MRARTTAAVVIAGAVMVLTAGCNFISPQATTEHYDASDGVSINVGDVEVRNAIVFTDNGDEASLSVTLLNEGSSDANVKIQYESLGSPKTVSVDVPAGETVSRGTQGGDEQILMNGIGEQAGSLLKVYIQYGSSTGKDLKVPVLDGSFAEYATLLPSPVATNDVVPTDSATPTP
ncbi:hypothetical protein EDF46_3012 [Frondihabitans sp. PhB188]|uniref:hypothetical protein n=1 Tax=Frondihabitans sp. PhB188 TaxID=2485200 RepID=UPI000F492EAB|nr:hypothetical protein [Frondihabitans sp. PhB188]ROQ37553.1 hypothetical protein EDF46_3012 [Frondihabitans sp. PhB188]